MIAVTTSEVVFACKSSACRPPPSGGTGGSNPSGGTNASGTVKSNYVHVNGKKMGSKISKASKGAHKGMWTTRVAGTTYSAKTKKGLAKAVADAQDKVKGEKAAPPQGPPKKKAAPVKKKTAAKKKKEEEEEEETPTKTKGKQSTDQETISKFDPKGLKGNDKAVWEDNMEDIKFFRESGQFDEAAKYEKELAEWVKAGDFPDSGASVNLPKGRNHSDSELMTKYDDNHGGHAGFNGGPPPKGLPDPVVFSDDNQVKALASYRGNGHRMINEALRTNNIDDVDDVISHIDAAFDQAGQTTADITVYRGWDTFDEGANKAMTSEAFRDDGFTSTTTNPDQTLDFGAGQIAIRIPKGSKVIRMSNSELEDEVLLPRGGTYTRTSDGNYTYQAP